MTGLFKRKFGRRGLSAAFLAGAVATAFGVAGAGTASAQECPGAGADIQGAGASLQKIAQQDVWNPAYNAACPSGPEVELYESIGSGAGLERWDANIEMGEIDLETHYVSTDDAPDAGQIKTITENANGAGLLTIPVAQAAVAVIVNNPDGQDCQVAQITNTELEEVFSGEMADWGGLSQATGNECGGASVTRSVREDGSGTTAQFKNYLSEIDHATSGLSCLGSGLDGWEELRDEEPNTTWPESCEGTELSPIVTGDGNTEVVNETAATEGSIAYANLADAIRGVEEERDISIIEVQNNGHSGSPTFGQPDDGEGNGNCQANNAIYDFPIDPATEEPVESWEDTEKVNLDWSDVYGSDPDIAGTTEIVSSYPICTLTYSLAFDGYATANEWEEGGVPVSGEAVAATVKDYLGYVVDEEGGQFDLLSHGYGLLFGEGPLFAAQLAINKIN